MRHMTAATVPRRTGPAPEVSASPAHYTAAELANRSARQLVDVLTGRRPLEQVRSWVSRPVAGLLITLVRSGRGPGRAYRLVSVHPCPTSPLTVEASAVISDDRTARALSLRLERSASEWSCTLLALV